MKPDQHVTISVGSGVILGMLLRSWVAGTACCLVGVLVDVDHFLDYWLNCGFSLDVKKLMDFCYNGTSRKFYDVLHAYEYIPFLCWLAATPGFRNLGLGMTVGYVLHILGDQLFNSHLSRWTYFISYRAFHGFSWSSIAINRTPAQSHPHGSSPKQPAGLN
jgi:membrane-bound metal-dependent hydrolase YbcI (DUF457 family)